MKKINIVLVGDSNTEGFGLDDPKYHISSKIEQQLPNCTVVNKGLSGSCVISAKLKNGTQIGYPYILQERYQEAIAQHADIYIINLGTNDGTDGMDDVLDIQYPEANLVSVHHQFKKDYLHIIDGLLKANPNAKIILCIPIPVRVCIWRKHQQKYVDPLIPIIYEIATENGYPVIDLFKRFSEYSDSEQSRFYQHDQLHLTADGTTVVADTILDTLKQFVSIL